MKLGDLLLPIGIIGLGVSSLFGSAAQREMQVRLKAVEDALQTHGISATAPIPPSPPASLQARVVGDNERGSYGK